MHVPIGRKNRTGCMVTSWSNESLHLMIKLASLRLSHDSSGTTKQIRLVSTSQYGERL